MNKTIKSLIGVLLIAILSFGMCTAAFATEGDSSGSIMDLFGSLLGDSSGDDTTGVTQDTSGDSSDSIMGLFGSLLGDSGTTYEDTTEAATEDISDDGSDYMDLLQALMGESGTEAAASDEFSRYSYDDFTIAFPAAWTVEESDDGGLTAASSDISKMASFMVIENADIDLTDQDTIDMLLESMGGEDNLELVDYIQVCGTLGLWFQSSFTEEGLSISAYSAILSFDSCAVYLTLGIFGGTEEENSMLFATILDSITVKGIRGTTDFSNVYSGDLINYVLVDPLPVTTSGNTGNDTSGQVLNSDEIVLIDDDICTVKITKIISDEGYYPLKFEMYAKNKTKKDITFSLDYVTVNDYLVSSFWYENVEAGKTVESDLAFYPDDIETCQIENIRSVEMSIGVSDYESWDELEHEEFVIYPFGTDVAEQDPYEFDKNDLELVDNDDIKMFITEFEPGDYAFKIYVYIENKTEESLVFNVSGSTSINGTEMNPYFTRTLPAGKKAVTYISWFNSDLEENGITALEEINLDLSVVNDDDRYGKPVYEDEILISFK